MRAAEAHRYAEPLGACRPRCRPRSRPARAAASTPSRSAATVTSAPARVRGRDQRRRGRGPRRTPPGTAGAARRTRPAAPRRRRSTTRTSMPSGSARVRDHRDGLRQRVGVDHVHRAAWLLDARRARVIASAAAVRLVEHRRVRRGQPGQVGDHGLEVQQRLQPALADLRLVRRVGRVPGRVLQHVAPDHRRACGCRSSPARSSTTGHRVAGGERPQLGDHLAPRWRPAAGPACRASGSPRGSRRPSARRPSRSRRPSSIRRWSSAPGPMCRAANCRRSWLRS